MCHYPILSFTVPLTDAKMASTIGSTGARWELPARRRCRVAVIGAGAAGLSAAQELLPKLSVEDPASCIQADNEPLLEPLIILEARDRVGGRIHTAELPSGMKVDMGAAWVHGTGVPFGSDGKKCDNPDELNPMVLWLQKSMDERNDDTSTAKEQKQDPLGAGLVYTSPRGNPDTRPRQVLHAPQGFDAADKDQHLVELYIGKQRVERDDANITKALDMYGKILASASRVGAAAFLCHEGMATSTISIGKTIDLVRKEAPRKYGIGYNAVDESIVETLLGFYLHILQSWHPHDLANVQLSEFIADETDFEVGEGNGKSAGCADDSAADDAVEQVHDEGGNEGDYSGPHCNVLGGMIMLLGPLQCNGVKECVVCEKEVTSLDWKDESATIVLTCADGLKVETDYVVVTLPIACLKAYNDMFRPPLSAEKVEAIKMLEMGSYKKVFLTFDEIFWTTNATFIGLARSQLEKPQLFGKTEVGLGNYLNVDNTHAKNHGEPLLEITLAGGAAQWATERDSDEIKKAVLILMDESMCTNDGSSFSSRCTGCYITRWEEDDFSKGAYAGFKLGTLERHAAALATPEWNGRLLFAGDAIIAEYEGSVHGALLSGKDAASKVLEQLDKT
jgi:monoamine oxidase